MSIYNQPHLPNSPTKTNKLVVDTPPKSLNFSRSCVVGPQKEMTTGSPPTAETIEGGTGRLASVKRNRGGICTRLIGLNERNKTPERAWRERLGWLEAIGRRGRLKKEQQREEVQLCSLQHKEREDSRDDRGQGETK